MNYPIAKCIETIDNIKKDENFRTLVTEKYFFFENHEGILVIFDHVNKTLVKKLNLFESSHVRWIEEGFIHIEKYDTGVIEIFNAITGRFHHLDLNEFDFIYDITDDEKEDIHDYDTDDITEAFDDLLSETVTWELIINKDELIMESENAIFAFSLGEDGEIIDKIIIKYLDPL